MRDRYEKIERFLKALSELSEGKYNVAEQKISEALAALAASPDLRELFAAVTKGFDYKKMRTVCLRFPAYEGAPRGAAYLPKERKDVLAFVFCLFMELDGGTLQLGDFLLRYFYVDGSYTASYLLFVERFILPFREIIRDCFPKPVRPNNEVFQPLEALLADEPARLSNFGLHEEESAACDLILGELKTAVLHGNAAEATALLAGYRYLLRYFGGEDETSAKIFALAARL